MVILTISIKTISIIIALIRDAPDIFMKRKKQKKIEVNLKMSLWVSLQYEMASWSSILSI